MYGRLVQISLNRESWVRILKVRGIYQFYLGYVLPRLEGGVNAEPIGLQAEEFQAIVSPRSLGEPLFPSDIDVSLASMTLTIQRNEGTEGGMELAVAASCFDRVQVMLDWCPDFEERDVEDELELSIERAVAAVDYYLEHYRHAARSPHVLPIARSWRPQDGRFYIGVPFSISWFNMDDNGAPLSVLTGDVNAHASSGAIKSPESGASSLEELNASLRTGAEPPLHLSLLIDADGYIQTLGLREATLALASACEIAGQLLVGRSGGNANESVRLVLASKNISFADRYYNRLPEAVGVESLVARHEKCFNLVEEMYRQRNSLIHSGAFKENVAALRRAERQKLVHSWLMAAREAVDWIDTVSPSS